MPPGAYLNFKLSLCSDNINSKETIVMKRHASAVWNGSLKEGSGTLTSQSGAFKDQPYSFKTRFQDESGQSGTNPEELIAAAHSGCFVMALSNMLAENGTPPEKLDAKAEVTLAPA